LNIPQPNKKQHCLLKVHRKSLETDSGISPDVIAERGYRTIKSRSAPELLKYKKYQRRAPSLYVPMFSPCGRRCSQIRPDVPRKKKNGDPVKYDSPTGVEPMIDVHPRWLRTGALKDASRRLWVTEGCKKGDALTSAGEVAITLAGVWMFAEGKKLYPGWDHISLKDRDVLIVYDSDVMVKTEVAGALERLSRLLSARGATVSIVYLSNGPNGEKVGVDDFLASGGTVAEMVAKAAPYAPQDFEYLRTQRNVELKDALAYLWEVYADLPTHTDAHNTARAIFRAFIRRTRKYGWVRKDKVLVNGPTRSLAIEARVGRQTAARHLAAFCKAGILELEKKPTGKKPARFVIPLPRRARSYEPYKGDSPTDNDSCSSELLPNNAKSPVGRPLYGSQMRAPHRNHENSGFCSTYDPCVPQVRGRARSQDAREDVVPELRWSAPGDKPTKKEIRAARTGASQVPLKRPREAVYRLGKRRAAILEHLLQAGGSCTVAELMSKFAGEKARARDFVRRQLGPMMYPAVIKIDGDCVSVTENWRAALEDQRDLGREAEANDLQDKEVRRQRRAYHNDVEIDEVPDMVPIDDMSKPWSFHVEGCACEECTKRFGPVLDEHVEGCSCKWCRAKRDGRVLPGQVIVWRESDPPPKPAEDPSEGHPLDCDCMDCSFVHRRYARPVERASLVGAGG